MVCNLEQLADRRDSKRIPARVCSPEQLAANRRNSGRSSGPKTPEGKAKSRRNGLKHGLTGAGVVIADEDVAAVEERFEAFEADLKPANDVARFLTRRAALLSVRLDRSAREEAARITLDMLEAEEVEEDARALEFEHLTASLAGQPAESVRKLRRSEEGIAWLIDAWRMARRDLLERDGLRWRVDTVMNLGALKAGTPQGSRIMDLNLAGGRELQRPRGDRLARPAAARAQGRRQGRDRRVHRPPDRRPRAGESGPRPRADRPGPRRGRRPRDLRRVEGRHPRPEVRGQRRTRLLPRPPEDRGDQRDGGRGVARGRGNARRGRDLRRIGFVFPGRGGWGQPPGKVRRMESPGGRRNRGQSSAVGGQSSEGMIFRQRSDADGETKVFPSETGGLS